MISYQPSFDPFHAIFRLFRLLPTFRNCDGVEFDKFRILDFYLCFPFRAAGIKFKRGHTHLRRVSQNYDPLKPYGGLPDDPDLFARMAPTQRLAIETLAAHGFIDPDALSQGWVLAGDVAAPEELVARVTANNEAQADLVGLLAILCQEYELMGAGGLKQRTGLLDYRYDAI